MKAVFFLGAGFSAPIGLPVMNAFFAEARGCNALTDKEKQFLERIQQFANEGVRLITIARRNFEEILSFLVMAEQMDWIPDEIQAATPEELKPDAYLRQIMRKVYGPVKPERLGQHVLAFQNLTRIKPGDHPHELTFITTNYDLIIESMLLLSQSRPRLPMAWVDENEQRTPDPNGVYTLQGGLLLCKLHGSVNWYADSANVAAQDVFTVENRRSVVYPSHMILPTAATQQYHNEVSRIPYMVPPTLFKHQTDARFGNTWSHAGSALREAERIIFIGYSFPKSDTYMRYFLGAALVKNVNLEHIRVVDPAAVEICERLRSDDQYGPHFKDLLRPTAKRWQTMSLLDESALPELG